MAGGSLTVTTTSYPQLQQVASRLLCWAGANSSQVAIDTQGGVTKLKVPEEAFAVADLLLEPNGVNVLAGYVAGTDVSYAATNGLAAQTPTCLSNANLNLRPTFTSIATNVGGDPAVVTLTFAHTVNVDIFWGDGTSDLNQIPGALNHTYSNGGGAVYTITMNEVSALTVVASSTVQLP